MKEYINRHKFIRLLSFLMDMLFVVCISIVLFHLLDIIELQDVIGQIQNVHRASGAVAIQAETIKLMTLIERYTIAIAILDGVYDFLCYTLFQTTLGKWLCKLKICYEADAVWKNAGRLAVRSIVKTCMMAFFGSIIFMLSGFAVIASPFQLSIQDRISKTKIMYR